VRRARAAGIAVRERSRDPEARAQLARLRRGDALEPALAAALRRALERLPTAPVPEPHAEDSEWVGASAAERGAALRQLLDLYGRIAQSRPPRRTRERARFPHFSSQRREAG
jgi:hypothetical protein